MQLGSWFMMSHNEVLRMIRPIWGGGGGGGGGKSPGFTGFIASSDWRGQEVCNYTGYSEKTSLLHSRFLTLIVHYYTL